MENSLTVPWNGNHRVYDPAIQLLEIYPEEMKRSAQKNYTSICNSIIRKSQKGVVPTDEYINKMWYILTMEHYLAT